MLLDFNQQKGRIEFKEFVMLIKCIRAEEDRASGMPNFSLPELPNPFNKSNAQESKDPSVANPQSSEGLNSLPKISMPEFSMPEFSMPDLSNPFGDCPEDDVVSKILDEAKHKEEPTGSKGAGSTFTNNS